MKTRYEQTNDRDERQMKENWVGKAIKALQFKLVRGSLC